MLTDISGGTSTQAIAQAFRAALSDPSIKAIIMEFDSPGGTAAGNEELAQEIYSSRGHKPVVAQVNSLCASAAYWIASACDEIAVTPSGQAGSIGTYSIHDDLSKAMEMAGHKETIIKSGKNKMMAPESQPLSDDARAVIQARVDQAQGMFTRAVARGRNVTQARVNSDFGQGLMFHAHELVKLGMADRVATLDDTIARFTGGHANPVAAANSTGRQFSEMHSALGDARKALGLHRADSTDLGAFLADIRKRLR
jgi:signal peptide peptidase SppA